MTNTVLVAEFLRERAWRQLDSAGASPLRVARSVVSLLDAAAYLRDVPDDDPDLLALAAAGCFAGGLFDPGPQGADIVMHWQLAGEAPADPRDLLAELVRAAHQASPATTAVSIPRQPGPADAAAPAPASLRRPGPRRRGWPAGR